MGLGCNSVESRVLRWNLEDRAVARVCLQCRIARRCSACIVGYISLPTRFNYVDWEIVMKAIVAGFVSAVFVAPLVFAGTPTSCPFSSKEIGAALGKLLKRASLRLSSDFGTGKSMSWYEERTSH